MNKTDKKVLEYLERAREIVDKDTVLGAKYTPLKYRLALEIAKMIQEEELDEKMRKLIKRES